MISKLRHIYGFYSASINTYRIVTIKERESLCADIFIKSWYINLWKC